MKYETVDCLVSVVFLAIAMVITIFAPLWLFFTLYTLLSGVGFYTVLKVLCPFFAKRIHHRFFEDKP